MSDDSLRPDSVEASPLSPPVEAPREPDWGSPDNRPSRLGDVGLDRMQQLWINAGGGVFVKASESRPSPFVPSCLCPAEVGRPCPLSARECKIRMLGFALDCELPAEVKKIGAARKIQLPKGFIVIERSVPAEPPRTASADDLAGHIPLTSTPRRPSRVRMFPREDGKWQVDLNGVCHFIGSYFDAACIAGQLNGTWEPSRKGEPLDLQRLP